MWEDWLAIVTWRGDAKRYCFEKVVDTARIQRDHWPASTTEERSTLEPAYTLGDQAKIPDISDAVESVLRIEHLEDLPRHMNDSCVNLEHCAEEWWN